MGDPPSSPRDAPTSDVELRERLRDQDHEGVKAAESERQRRAQERSSWPVRLFRLGSEPNDDLRGQTTAEERLSMMWELARRAWLLSGRRLPEYDRATAPGRVVRPAR